MFFFISEMKTLVLLSLVIVSHMSSSAQNIRPVRDDVGFCWNADAMKTLMEYLKKNEKETFNIPDVIAGISPHDDYLYASRVYFPLYPLIKTKEVVIFGVTHGTVRKEIGDPQNILILDSYDAWKGLKKNISVSPLREFIKAHLDTSCFTVQNNAHALEHSIEALVPFVEFYNPEIKITPVMVTAMPFDRMETVSQKLAEVISAYIKTNNLQIGRDISFLISCDANHYGKDFNNIPFGEDAGAHQSATQQDRRIATTFLSGDVSPEKIKSLMDEMKNVVWCGKFSVPFGLLTIQNIVHTSLNKTITGKLLRYSDTYTEGIIPLKQTGMGTTAPFSLKHWVGFFSAAYQLK